MFTRAHRKNVFEALDELEEDVAEDGHLIAPSNTGEGGSDDDAPADQDEPTDADDSVPATTDVEPPAGRIAVSANKPILRRVVSTLATVIAVAALAVVSWLAWQVKQHDDTDKAARDAVAAAREYGVELTSISSKNVDQNFEQVLDGATGEFKDMYGQSAAQLRQLLVDNNAEATGTVIDAAVKSATKTKVEVLLFIDQAVTNRIATTPRLDRNRVSMTMEYLDNRWLASKVDVV